MYVRIQLERATVKALSTRLVEARQHGQVRLVTRITALLLVNHVDQLDEIIGLVQVARSSFYRWLAALLADGLQSVQVRRPTGRPAKLTKTQKQRLVELITAGPEAARYTSACWNSALIQDLILREFQVEYNLHYICALLRNLGFSYQKARFVADHLDPAKRHVWLEHVWPTIVAEAQQRHALLLFGDEASFAQWGSLGYTWAPRGQQPVVKTSGMRKAYKVFGLLAYCTGQLFVQGQTERFTAATYCAFLSGVLATTTQPIILVQDGARYHTAKATHAFFAQHADRLTVYQLPSYSPDYNPIEHLWRNVKRQATHNHYFATFGQLVAAVDAGLTYYQQHADQVRTLMKTCLDAFVPVTQPA